MKMHARRCAACSTDPKFNGVLTKKERLMSISEDATIKNNVETAEKTVNNSDETLTDEEDTREIEVELDKNCY